MLLKDFISGAVSALEKLYVQNEARAMVFRLCEDVLGTKSYTHIVDPDAEVDRKKQPQLEEMLARLESGEPLQYVIGHTEFCGFDFRVSPDVLIPRPETEQLCRHATEYVSRISRMRSSSGKFASPVRVLDLCTGSGCIAWSIALSVPGVETVAVDISEKALEVARSQNFRDRMKADHDIKAPVFVHADVLDTETPFEYGPFDVDGKQVTATRVLSLDANSHFVKWTTTFDCEGADSIAVVLGAVMHDVVGKNAELNWIAFTEKASDSADPERDGNISVAVIYDKAELDDNPYYTSGQEAGHAVIITEEKTGKPVVTWTGSGWSQGGVASQEAWAKTVREFSYAQQHPLKVSVR